MWRVTVLIVLSTFASLALSYTSPDLVSLDGCKTPFDMPSLQDTHREIREKFVANWKRAGLPDGVVYIEGGVVSLREGTDTELQFRQESNFLYISGVTWPDFSVAIDIVGNSFRTILFAPERDVFWATWNGVVETKEEMSKKYGIADVLYDTEMMAELRKISAGKTIYTLKGTTIPGFNNVNDALLLPVLSGSRVVKTSLEIKWMEIAANVSSDAHVAVMKDSSAGIYEYNFAGFFEYYTKSCGLLHQSYLPIVGYGKHAAILHYNVPLSKVGNDGLMLIDAGAELTWATDITRTFPVNGKFSEKQKLIYNSVLQIVLHLEAIVKPGVRFSELGLKSRELATRYLLEAGFIQGNFDELMRNAIYSYFYPHGLGHSVGIDVHDPGSIENLQQNMVLTIEPGIYFNEVLLNQGFTDKGQYFNKPKCSEFLSDNFGGVRIEDTIRVTADGMKVLSTVPKTVEEIEKIMAKNDENVIVGQ